ncbi:hypothetical protein V2W30_01715 [Streptomyces sp. Q6]|uniref:Uncharacterized protein n=1 Tax=Streptomyces citrinus TaxID=3118173 RepID=A0ACD5A4T4_9ACTN
MQCIRYWNFGFMKKVEELILPTDGKFHGDKNNDVRESVNLNVAELVTYITTWVARPWPTRRLSLRAARH